MKLQKNTSARLSSWFRGCLVAVAISASSTAAASIAGLGFADVEDIESGTVTYLPAFSASTVTTDQGAQVVFGFSTMGGPQNPTWSAPTNTIAITGEASLPIPTVTQVQDMGQQGPANG